MKLYCIADEDTVRGFRLAGVPGECVSTAAQATAAVNQAVAQMDCGIIVLTVRVANGIRPLVETIQFERERPLIIEIPGPEGCPPDHKSLRQIVQEAVGIRVGP